MKHVRTEPLVMTLEWFRWFVLATLTGLLVGGTTSLFLHLLFFSSGLTAHIALWQQMLLLPAAGLVTGLMIHYGAPDAAGHGTEAVITAVHENEGRISLTVAPVKTLATVITLACGGSAGKEGPCAQIGGAIASAFANLIRLDGKNRKRLVICGISAGFSSVFGTPLAGTIFGIEVLAIGGLTYDVLLPSFIAGLTSFELSKALGIPYSTYVFERSIPFSETFLLKIMAMGILFGLISWLFIEIFERLQQVFQTIRARYIRWKPAIPALGGVVLSLFIIFVPVDYLGLSLPLMNTALAGEHIQFLAFFWKLLFVSITLASGFSGGIVTPLFVIGSTAGNALAHVFHIDPVLGSDIGMMAVLASASNTPISAVIMGMELFGGNVAIYVLAASITAYVIVGHRSVYPSQILTQLKSSWIHLGRNNIPLAQAGDMHISYSLMKRAMLLLRMATGRHAGKANRIHKKA